jgi:hypothetical protein
MGTESFLEPEIKPDLKHAFGSEGNIKAELPPLGRAHHRLYIPYSSAVIAMGTAVLFYSAYSAFSGNMGLGWIPFAVLTFITAAFSLKMPKTDIRVSVPDVFIFSSILLFGPAAGALTAAMEGLMGSLRAKTKSRKFGFAVFNMAALSLSAFTAGKVYEILRPLSFEGISHLELFQQHAFSIVILAVYYFILNTGLLTFMISLEKRRNLTAIWMECFSWMGIGYLAAGLMAGILSSTTRAMNTPSLALLVIVPVVTYMAYRHTIRTMRENIELKEKAAA